MLRSAAINIVSELKVEGGCNCQFALHPNSFEYAVISGVNDSAADAEALARLLKGMNCHINLIPVSKIKARSYSADRKSVEQFMKRLEKLGMNVTIRRTLGADINAACGQLRREYEI